MAIPPKISMFCDAGKANVVEKLLKLGFSNESIDDTMELHTWIDGNEGLNLQILTDIIVSTQHKANKKRKLSQTDNSDTFQPPLKKIKSISDYKKYYNDIIQLLNEGVVSYSNSKKQIRTILEQKYNYPRKYLKHNKDFDQAVDKIVDDLNDIVNDDTNNNTTNAEHSSSKPVDGGNKLKTLRDLKAELTTRSGGCRQHGLGPNIYFEKLSDCLEIHCNICEHSLIHELSLPSHLQDDCNDSQLHLLNDNAIAQETDSKMKKCLNEWNCNAIIYFLNRVDNGKLNDIKYKCLKQQIKIGKIKGFELKNINDTTLKLIGMDDFNDRKLVLNCILKLNLITNTDVQLDCGIDICECIPDLYCDAISCELMEDPVSIAISGHTYERKFIENYVGKYGVDPITKHKCEFKDIVSNKSLKKSIVMWISTQQKNKSAQNT